MSHVSFMNIADLLDNGVKLDHEKIYVRSWRNKAVRLPKNVNHYGVALKGSCKIRSQETNYTLPSNSYFQVRGEAQLAGGEGLLISIQGFPARPLRMGLIPENAAIKYKPGGEMLQLLHPDVKGEPSLNMLKIEPLVEDQEDHYHESLRVNVVVAGTVICETHTAAPKEITRGGVIIIPAGCYHRFKAGPEGMRFVAFHPDSRFGPTSEDNTMFSNTFFG